MQANILWTGLEYYSLENCLVSTTDSGAEINSTIIGNYGEKLYKVEYRIHTNHHWETIFAEIKSRHSDQQEHILLESDGKGNWLLNGKPAAQFNDCIDIDIPLTPFTNTLPINRLKLAPGQKRQLSVIYLDLLEGRVKPVRQQYTRLSATEFHYENVPNDFEATITVDEAGLVVDYPALFVRSAKLFTNYREAGIIIL